MRFGHEQLDVYKISLEYIRWVYGLVPQLRGYSRNAREQLLRASQSILLNIAEGNGKSGLNDRRRFFEIARGSALECAAIQDVLEIGRFLTHEENEQAKKILIRIVSMLSKMQASCSNVKESFSGYGDISEDLDYENEYDYEYDKDLGHSSPKIIQKDQMT